MTSRAGQTGTAQWPSHARSLRVLVNATALRVGGGSTFIVEQLAALTALPALKVTALATTDIAQRLRAACGPAICVQDVPERKLLRRVLHEQFVLPVRTRAYDVVYQPGGFAMFASLRPQAVTNQNPHHFPAEARAYWRQCYPQALRLRLAVEWRMAHASVRRAEAFIAVSEAFQYAIEQDLGRRDNLHLVRSAAPSLPAPATVPLDPGRDSGPYALTVAHDYIHKDWDGLIRTFREHHDLPRLVVVGAWRSEERRLQLERQFEANGDPDRVTLLGPIADRRRIAALYREATCFVAHSFLEAGPLTPGEALTNGVSLVASDIPPHREAGGVDAHYYNPSDLSGLAEAVRSAIADTPSAGPTASREAEWTWTDNATRLADILRSIADHHRATRA